MKAILPRALALGACGLAGAADNTAADPAGTWECAYEIGGQQRTSTLKIKKDGDNFAGTMSWPDQDETKLRDPKLKDGTLTFSAERKLPGMDDGIAVEYKLTVDGDQLKGKGAAEFGGEKREWDIEGKRQKNDTSWSRSLEGSDGSPTASRPRRRASSLRRRVLGRRAGGHKAGWYIGPTEAAATPSSVATASAACWATSGAARPSEV